jgi:hypothetical protein
MSIYGSTTEKKVLHSVSRRGKPGEIGRFLRSRSETNGNSEILHMSNVPS